MFSQECKVDGKYARGVIKLPPPVPVPQPPSRKPYNTLGEAVEPAPSYLFYGEVRANSSPSVHNVWGLDDLQNALEEVLQVHKKISEMNAELRTIECSYKLEA